VEGGLTDVRPALLRVLAGLALLLGAAIMAMALAGPPAARAASGSGIASESPNAILAASVSAIDGVSSVRVSGSGVENGAPISLNLALVAGKGGEGSVSEGGVTFSLVLIGNTLYFKGSTSFWRKAGAGSAAQLLAGKWLKTPTTGEFAAVTSFARLRTLFGALLNSHGVLAKGAVTTVRGQQVVPLIDRSKGGTLYVAATGKPYPVEIVNQKTKNGTVVIGGIDQPIHLVAPPGAIDISKLGG
jgi:hypothetical protein